MLKKFGKKLLALALAFSMVIPAPTASTVQAAETDQETTVIDVTEYGADPSGKNDSTAAVIAALEEAKKIEGHKTLNFPKGEYRFDEDHATKRIYHTSNTSSRSFPEKKISILLEDVHNMTIDGNDSTLLVYGDIMALAVVESSNIKMQDLVLDYKDADTIDVSVVKTDVDENGKPYAEFYIPAAYNYKISDDGQHIQWQGDISAETGKPYWTWDDANFCAYLVVYKGYDRTVIRAVDKTASNPFTGVTKIEKSGESTVRFTYESQHPTDVVEGNIYQLSNSATRRTSGAFFWESENLAVENIDVHYLSGFGWLTQMCMNVEFKGVDFLPRIGSGKYTTSNADQLHVAGCGGYFKVTDCNFSMAHDDPINVHGTYMRVEEVIDSRTIKMKYIHGQQGGFRQFHANDEVLFYSRTYLEEPAGQQESQPFIVASSIAPGEVYNGEKLDLVTEIVTFTEDLPEATLTDLRKTVTKDNAPQGLYVAENVTFTPEVIIKGNYMKSIPTRGILCTTRKNVLIEDNIFDNMAMANIYLSNDANDWYESGPIRNLTIRGNTFYVRPTGQAGVGVVSGIFIEPITFPSAGQEPAKDPKTLVHENITIEDNIFHISNDNVVTANRVKGLTIRNNTIIHDDPALSIKVTTNSTLGEGKSQDITYSVTETLLQKDIFQFNDCQDVTVSGNTYDEGMNLNIQMDNKMSQDELTLGEHDASVLNINQDKLVSNISKVQLVSTNPDVAFIDETGKLKAVSRGTTTVYGYIEKNGTILKSNEVEVTVGDAQVSELTLTSDKEFFTSKDETATLTASQTEVTYQVVDPITGKASDKAVITGNTYTAKKDGAVVVKASTASASAEILMVNSFANSYGTLGGLADGIHIANPTEGHTSSVDEHSIKITAQANNNGVWANGPGVNNVVNIKIPDEMRTDLRLQVTAEGLLSYGSGYSSSGIMLYNENDNVNDFDYDNYVFAGKRGHFQGVATIREENANAPESGGDASANNLTSLTFEFVIQNTTLTIRYRDDSGNWHNVNTFDVAYLQSKEMKLGLISWLNSSEPFAPTYSNIRMAKASASTEDMSNVQPQVLFKSFTNGRPEVESVILEVAEVNKNATATVVAQDKAAATTTAITDPVSEDNTEDGSESISENGTVSGNGSENGNELDNGNDSGSGANTGDSTATDHISDTVSILYQWKLQTEDGIKITYSDTNQYLPKEPGELTVTAIAFDDYKKPGRPVTSASKTVGISLNDKDELQNLYINGNPIKGFAPNIYSYEVDIPNDLRNLRISIDGADAGKATTIVGASEITIDEGKTSAVVPVHDSYTITRGEHTYTVKINRILSNGNKLLELKIDGKAINLNDEIKAGTNSYFVQVEKDSFPLRLTAQESVKDIKVKYSYYEKDVADLRTTPNIFEANIDMTAGINAYYIDIVAADGISTREVKLYLFRDSYTDAGLEGISINGRALEGFNSSTKDYLIQVTPEEAAQFKVDVSAKADQNTSITFKNNRVEGTSRTIALESGLNEIIIANVAKNLWSKNFYTLNVVVTSDDNADLLSLTTDGLLKPEFDIDTTSYELKNNSGKLTVSANSQVAEANIHMYLRGSEQSVSGNGHVSKEFDLYEGRNVILVDVTAKDGTTTKTYQLNVNTKGLVYASDVVEAVNLEGVTNTKKQVGYESITLDTNIDKNGKIALVDESGNKVEFDKGLGTHAAAEVIFTFEAGHQFEYFETYTGVDYSKLSSPSTVNFQVWVDGLKMYDSLVETGAVTTPSTPMKFVQIDISNATELKLITDASTDGISYDHAVWADAAFTRSLAAHPNPEPDPEPTPDPGPGTEDETNEGLWITGVADEYEYTGANIIPEVLVYEDGKLLIEKKDYTLVHKNNKNAFNYAEGEDGFEDNKAKAPYVEVKMKGNNAGSKKIYYKITPVDLDDVVLDSSALTVVVKNDKPVKVTPVLYWNGKKLSAKKDYTITGATTGLTVGTHKLTISAVEGGNFTGVLDDVEVNITKEQVESKTVVAMSKVNVKGYAKSLAWTENGAEQTGYQVTHKTSNPVFAEDTTTEYTVDYKGNDKVGTAYMILTGTGVDGNDDGVVFQGTKTVSFKVTGTTMNKKNIAIEGSLDRPYNDGEMIRPTDEVAEDGTAKVTLKAGNVTLEEGTHYTVRYAKNIEKGTATVTFKGIESAGFTGSYKVNFKITAKPIGLLDIEVPGAEARDEKLYVPYTKGTTTPSVEVVDSNGKILESGKDYTVKYKNNKAIGQEAELTVTGKGNYGESATIKFVIEAKELSNENGIQVVVKDKVNNGKANNWNQSVKVLDSNGKALTANKDYDKAGIEFWIIPDEKGINTEDKKLEKGTMAPENSLIEVRVKGTNDYKAQGDGDAIATGTFRILPNGYDIKNAKITINSQAYTGSPITITDQKQFTEGKVYLQISKGNKYVLELGKDIEVVENSYVKNKNKGTAKVTFRGIGDFGGTKTVSFKITARNTDNLWDVIRNLFN